MITELSLFTGYSGISLGVKLAGINTRTIAYVEWEKYPQEIIKARIKDGYLDDAPIFSDISSFRGEQFRGMVDLITAGFPCQPHSVAGVRKSSEDSRNKWPDTLRVISEVAPRYVLLENVSGLLSSSVDERTPAYGGVVVGQLTEIGYDCFWEVVGADDAGAPHRRKRWFCFGTLGNPKGERTGRIRDESQEARSRGSNVSSRIPGGIHTGNMAASEGRQSGEPTTRNWGEGAERGSTELADSTSERLQGHNEQPAQSTGTFNGYNQGELADSNGIRYELEKTNRDLAGRERSSLSNIYVGYPRGIPSWPPGPSQSDEWGRVLTDRPDLAPAITNETQSIFRGMVDGRSHRVDELKALGNGVVPAVVALFLRRLLG